MACAVCVCVCVFVCRKVCATQCAAAPVTTVVLYFGFVTYFGKSQTKLYDQCFMRARKRNLEHLGLRYLSYKGPAISRC